MKLSTAIRLGAMLKPQTHRPVANGETHSCALMAAGDALGLDAMGFSAPYAALRQRYPFLRDPPPPCPACLAQHSQMFDTCDLVWFLNDNHKWTRERIADWIATIEPQEVPPVARDIEHILTVTT